MATEKTPHTTHVTHPAPHTREARPAKKVENSTDATQGEPLAVRAAARRVELEAALAKLPAHELRARTDIEMALAAITALLVGDPDHPSESTAAAINTWLESSKHLAETAKPAKSRA